MNRALICIGLVAVALVARAPGQDDDFVAGDDWTVHQCDSACPTCAALAPRWLARGSVVYMDRVTGDSPPLFQNVSNPLQQISAGDFDFGWSAGFDVSLTRKAWDDSGFEWRYLDLGQLDAGVFTVIGGTDVMLNSPPPVFLPNVQSIGSRYTSDLISFEANYRYVIDDSLTYLLGFRYVGLDDDLIAHMDAAPQSFLYRASTRNDLYGAQVGAEGFRAVCCGRLLASAIAKIGVYGNDPRNQSLIDTGAASLRIDDSSSRVAWVGELGVAAEVPLTDCFSIFAGYRMLWLENIASAGDQMAVSDFFNGVGISNRGDTIFHGGHVGIALEM